MFPSYNRNKSKEVMHYLKTCLCLEYRLASIDSNIVCVEDDIKPRGSCEYPVTLTEGMSPSYIHSSLRPFTCF